MKYITSRISGIITQIAENTEIVGYTKGVIEVFLPDEGELTAKQEREWIKKNNKRMQRLCEVMNQENL